MWLWMLIMYSRSNQNTHRFNGTKKQYISLSLFWLKIVKHKAQALTLHGRESTLSFIRLSLSASFPSPLQPHFRPQLSYAPQSPPPSPNTSSALSPSLPTSNVAAKPICPKLEAASPENPFFFFFNSAEEERGMALNVSCPKNVNHL